MALPTSYTDATIKAYMVTYLGALATALGLTSASFDEAANDLLLAYGVSDFALATDVVKLRALAKVAAVRHAQTVVATWYDFSADGASFSRSQVQSALAKMLVTAEGDAMTYGPAYAISAGSMSYPDDPYPLTVVDSTVNDDSEVV